MSNQTTMKFRVYDTLKQRYVIDPHLCAHAISVKDGISEIRAREPAFIIEPFTGFEDIFGEELYEGDVIKEAYFLNINQKLTHEQEQFLDRMRAAEMIIKETSYVVTIATGVHIVITLDTKPNDLDNFVKCGNVHDEKFRRVDFRRILFQHYYYTDSVQRMLYKEAVAAMS